MSRDIVWDVQPTSGTLKTTFADFKSWHDFMVNRGLDETKYQLTENIYNDLMWMGGNIYLKYSNINRNRMECFYEWRNTINFLIMIAPLQTTELEKLMQQITVNKGYAPSGDDSDNMNGSDPKPNTNTYLYNTTVNASNPSFMMGILSLKSMYFNGYDPQEFLIKNFLMKVMAKVQPRSNYAD